MESFAFHFNLWQLSNASAMWMGMNPPDIFLYIFLPPLLLDNASRIEFFMFRKVTHHCGAPHCLPCARSGAQPRCSESSDHCQDGLYITAVLVCDRVQCSVYAV